MPQMMPINWIFSFMFFICIFIIFNIMNYFIFYNNSNKMFMMTKTPKNMTWKW